jgi:hypothetical protein
MKIMRLAETAEAAKARIEAFLASDPKSELARMHIARGIEDILPARMPEFVCVFLRHAFDQRPVG